MKPSLSLILFSVLSGAGFGLFVLLVGLTGLPPETPLNRAEGLTAGILALALVLAGLLSSTGHLSNPKNGIKAFARFRSSWLSREASFAVLFMPLALLFLLGLWNAEGAPGPWTLAVGILAAAAALATVFSMSMIYASLKTIRQWHNPLVPAAYLAIGLATGGVLLAAIRVFHGQAPSLAAPLALGLLVAAALVKAIYYFWIGQPEGPSIQTATSLPNRRTRLLDVGHSHGNFLTDEFGHQLRPGPARLLRLLVLVLGFLLPLALLPLLQAADPSQGLAAALVASVAAGVLLERWLFLIEGTHVVMLYHGRQRT